MTHNPKSPQFERAPRLETVNGEVVIPPEARAWLIKHRWCWVDGKSAHLDNAKTGVALRRAFRKPRLKLRLDGRVEEIA
jgi:hypothetical protein